jgi:hypothetical protein
MAEKHIVVQGAQCMCNFGTAPDKLKVLTNQKEYANDKEGSQKPIATTMDIGTTFEKICLVHVPKQIINLVML